MIIEDNLKLRVRVYHRMTPSGEKKDYRMMFVTFSSKFSPILQKFKELHNVELITPDERITLPKVNLYLNSYNYRRKTGERIPQYGFTIPVLIAEKLLDKGVKKVKVIAEIPEGK